MAGATNQIFGMKKGAQERAPLLFPRKNVSGEAGNNQLITNL
jgi:hypothetical protein